MADVIVDSDLLIWHLRGRPAAVEYVRALSARGRLGVCAISRTEVLAGARPRELPTTEAFLDACETLPVDARVADRAAAWIRAERRKGLTVAVADALIGATAALAGIPLHTCNARHFQFEGLDVRNASV